MSQATLGGEPFHNANLFSNYYLTDRIGDLDGWDCDSEATEAFEKLQTLWEFEGGLVDSYGEDELLASWIDRVLEVLGFDWLAETTLPDGGGYTDRLLFDSPETRREAAARKQDGEPSAAFGRASAVLEAKQWDVDFSRRFSEGRSYYDASQQLKYYLERTPERLGWGILTNGRKWRLYGTKDYATEIYYEVDLPALLMADDLEAFKYFYAMFRPEAFAETAGSSFLDRVWSESETAAQQLGADLQDNVFTALRLLGEGFIETNDLAIDPTDAGARAELKEQSLVLLYRLMFILYAESRGLIHPDDPDKQAEYDEHFSLEQRLLDIHESISSGDSYEDYSGYSTQLWGRLEDLFGLIDEGEPALGIPPYNGGLFDDSTHEFLADNEVSDRYLAEVIHRLGTTEGEGERAGQPVIADYADLDTRHLGSIYEGLLEHEFRIAPEQYAAVSADGGEVWKPATEVSVADAVETVEAGQLYVVNDDGERKATGAYYTPDYVVSYIVEETIDPLIAEIKADLADEGMEPGDTGYFAPFFERITELTVLDPAMGSGHFLTSATAYLTEQVMEVVRQMEVQSYDEQDLRRQIAKECIYGVDINGMAVELGKLSMWLETLAADKPLAFLDHHLKAGNSLVGSDITEVLRDESENSDGQLTLSQSFARARQQTLGHVMELMADLLAIDNEKLEDIKSMEELYDEIRDDPLYQRLFEIANVHTAAQFGVDVPEGVYEDMAGAIDDGDKWAAIQEEDWFTAAQATAAEQSFFHWELEYPEVFFGDDGTKLESAGFDAVIGNPPYFNLETTKGTGFNYYLRNQYEEIYSGKADVLYFFCDHGYDLINSSGVLSFIVSRYFTEAFNAKDFREKLTDKSDIHSVLDFGNNQVFPGIDTLTIILSLVKAGSRKNTNILTIDDSANSNPAEIESILSELQISGKSKKGGSYKLPQSSFDRERWLILPKEIREVKRQIQSAGTQLGNFSRTGQGMMTGLNEAFTVTESEIKNWNIEKEVLRPLVKNGDLRRYIYLGNDKQLIYLENEEISNYPNTETYLEQYKDDLKNRAKGDSVRWYRYQNPINKDLFEEYSQKIICPFIATGNRFYVDKQNLYNDGGDIELIIQEEFDTISDYYLVALLNSKLLEFYHLNHAKLKRDGFYEYFGNSLQELPIVTSPRDCDIQHSDEAHDTLVEKAKEIAEVKQKKNILNLSLLDHLGAYDDGPTLAEIGLTQPPRGSAESILQQTATEKPNLRIGEASVIRESPNTVEIRLTARYKPSEARPKGGPRTGTGEARGGASDDLDESAFEVDQWGYTETEPEAALRITDLTEAEADLIEAFVPVAVDEGGGFAGFRETATKTNSLVDRLRKLTLPRVADVEAGLESYVQTKERAEELEAKIESTDRLLDEIVYELYGLTDEEIEIVEEAVGE